MCHAMERLTTATQQAAAQLDEIAHIQLAVAVLVQQTAQNATRHAALRLDLAAFLTQCTAQIISAHALRLHAAGQEGHDQWSQQGQQLTGVTAQTGSLAQLGLRLLLLAAEDIAQNRATCASTATGTTQQTAKQATQKATPGSPSPRRPGRHRQHHQPRRRDLPPCISGTQKGK